MLSTIKEKMNKKIFIDHCYNIDQNHKFLKKLEKIGFTLDKNMMEHPGKAYCRFIMFRGENPRKRFYLEFVSIGKGGSQISTPGLSLGYETKLSKFHKTINKEFPAKYWHKNFEWKINNEDHLPGWNFIEFKKPIIQNINTWFTEYETSYKRQKPVFPRHKNLVKSLHGLVLSLSPKSKKNLEFLLGVKINNKITLKDGITIYINRSKTDQFESIILNSSNIKLTKKVLGRSGKDFNFLDEKMIKIDPPKNDKVLNWNILIKQIA